MDSIQIPDWRQRYGFLGIFYCNSFIISLIIGFESYRYNTITTYYLVKLITSTIVGIGFDYFSTKLCLLIILVIGLCTGLLDFIAIAIVPASVEVIFLSYICDIVSDNCKAKALSEMVMIQLIASSLGSLLSLYIPMAILSQLFVPCACFILLIINVACFDEIPKALRPNISPNNEKTTHPNYIGVFICLLLLITSDVQYALLLNDFTKDFII